MGRFRSERSVAGRCNLFCWARRMRRRHQGRPASFPGKGDAHPRGIHFPGLGGTLNFHCRVQTASGTNLNTAITYTSSDTSVVNITPNGVACAGHWDAAFTSCTPGASGVALVTASALGGSSVPTYVFVHPPIDNITVGGILHYWRSRPGALPLAVSVHDGGGPRLQPGHRHNSIRRTVHLGHHEPYGFTLTPLPNTCIDPITKTKYNFATNQATATAVTSRHHPHSGISRRRDQYILPAAHIDECLGRHLAGAGLLRDVRHPEHRPRSWNRRLRTNESRSGQRWDLAIDRCHPHRHHEQQLPAEHRRGSRAQQNSVDLERLAARSGRRRNGLYSVLYGVAYFSRSRNHYRLLLTTYLQCGISGGSRIAGNSGSRSRLALRFSKPFIPILLDASF